MCLYTTELASFLSTHRAGNAGDVTLQAAAGDRRQQQPPPPRRRDWLALLIISMLAKREGPVTPPNPAAEAAATSNAQGVSPAKEPKPQGGGAGPTRAELEGTARERAPRSARVPAGGRPQRTLETCWGDPGSTVSSAFTDLAPPAPRLPLPLKESFYEEEVRELGPPGVSRAPKMRSIRKRWTICTISLLLIFYKTKEMARTEEHQETQLIG